MKIAKLDQFSTLYKEYVSGRQDAAIRKYFAFAPNEFTPEYEAFVRARADAWQENHALRTSVAELIRAHHEKTGTLDEHVTQNIAALRDGAAVAIVTGQQVGLFGGPMYTIYKAATAIARAREISRRYPDINAVPIFWLETEDHDIEETSSTMVLDREFSLKTVRYEPSDLPQPMAPNPRNWRKQVGGIPLEAAPLEATYSALREGLSPTEFTEGIIDELQDCYANGTTFAEAFSMLLARRFEGSGLLIIDANHPTAKRLAKDLFHNELESSPQLSERIILKTVELEEKYHAQVKPRALNLFYLDGGERFPLVEKEGLPDDAERSFFLQGTKRTLTKSQLLGQVEDEPERFSPNVVLRPLYQDTLLPTIMYIAGPGEIAYFAQFSAAYEWASIPMPMFMPRASATLVEEKFSKIAEKYDSNMDDILAGGREETRRVLEALSDSTLAPKFDAASSSIDAALESVRDSVKRTDATLDDSLTTMKGKMLTMLRDFLSKTLAADRKRYANVKGHFEKLLNALLPHEVLQEREINLVYFLNKYGAGIWEELKLDLMAEGSAIDEHRVIYVSDLIERLAEKKGAHVTEPVASAVQN